MFGRKSKGELLQYTIGDDNCDRVTVWVRESDLWSLRQMHNDFLESDREKRRVWREYGALKRDRDDLRSRLATLRPFYTGPGVDGCEVVEEQACSGSD